MKVFLVVWFLVNGAWVPGNEFDGWGPLPMTDMAECEMVRDEANAAPWPEDWNPIRFECVER